MKICLMLIYSNFSLNFKRGHFYVLFRKEKDDEEIDQKQKTSPRGAIKRQTTSKTYVT